MTGHILVQMVQVNTVKLNPGQMSPPPVRRPPVICHPGQTPPSWNAICGQKPLGQMPPTPGQTPPHPIAIVQ